MNDVEFRNKITIVNGKWDQKIKSLQKELLACEQKLGSLGTPLPGKLPPVLSATQKAEQRVLEQRLRTLIPQFNQASRNWLADLLKIPKPASPTGLKQKIPWPNWVGEKSKDFVIRCIDQGGLPITDRVTIKKPPGTWTGIMVEYNW